MQFQTEHFIPGVDVQTFEHMFFDEALNKAICQALHMHRTLLSRHEADGKLNRRVEIQPERQLPALIQKAIGSNRLIYRESMLYTFGTGEANWEIIPTLFPERIHAEGVVGFRQGDGGTFRYVKGEVQVKFFGIGGIAERFIVSDIEDSFAQAATLTERYVKASPQEREALYNQHS